eukprot:CAMPEP_0175059024 /NCGR_PEP_ID=MMETSP0052_2-20121109/12193_1 /TAXON_ID=51329 ORGANISM="Polytomella parva, Strain SAG 63-3" /NCGR_SAMPLE_ID=MMETSP0052_2 /ASSEMBLY_ACC=CAM_ASM_000194 /LENGTH=323 /DNA_ID=CAMNT_0016324509 /DNA_START=32 /DNA_END=1000 /DNA_ORIENTATION=-
MDNTGEEEASPNVVGFPFSRLPFDNRLKSEKTASSSNHERMRIAKLARLDKESLQQVSRSVQNNNNKQWLHNHGYVVKAEKLHPAVVKVIEQWFCLVDDDGSRTLEHHELLAALKAAQIPCDDQTIQEMIHLMDFNGDGVIGWEEFEVFMTEEFSAGKNLLSGEYVLPSGLALNFGVMIGKLKRDKLIQEVMEDESRKKWADVANDPKALAAELAMMQEATDAAGLSHERKSGLRARTTQHDTLGGGGGGGDSPRTLLTNQLLRSMEEEAHYKHILEKRRLANTTHGRDFIAGGGGGKTSAEGGNMGNNPEDMEDMDSKYNKE